MQTRLTKLIGIETPIIFGGMMRVGTADLAAAASNAGALGVMTALSQPTPEGLEAEIARCGSLTNKPFGVNLTVGMCCGLINDVPSCEELVRNIVSDAEQIIDERLASITAA